MWVSSRAKPFEMVEDAHTALHLSSWKDLDAEARLTEIKEVVRLADNAEKGIVALALERAAAHDEGSLHRSEADAFASWAAGWQAEVSAAAKERQAVAEVAYEEQRQRTLMRAYLDAAAVAEEAERRAQAAKALKSPQAGPSPKAVSSGMAASTSGVASPTPKSNPYSELTNLSALFVHLRPAKDSGGLAKVKLLRSEWLVARAQKLREAKTDAQRAALALPRRQDLEQSDPNAFYTPEEVEMLPRGNEYGSARTRHLLHVVCVSYAWETPTHPDPLGHVILHLADQLQRAQNITIKDARGNDYRKLPERLGIFFDWVSVTQADKRDMAEQAAFDAALRASCLFFAHASTTTLVLAQPPRGGKASGKTGDGGGESGGAMAESAVPYAQRGWPTFERRVAFLAKKSLTEAWPQVIDSRSIGGPMCPPPPLTIEAFRTLLHPKKFTRQRDRPILLETYKKTAEAMQANLREQRLDGVGWNEAQLLEMCTWLARCEKTEALTLTLADAGIVALCDALTTRGAVPKLCRLSLRAMPRGSNAQLSSAGISALTTLLAQGWMHNLKQLYVPHNVAGGIGDLQRECERRSIAFASRDESGSRPSSATAALSRSLKLAKENVRSLHGSLGATTTSLRRSVKGKPGWRPGGLTGQKGSGLAFPLSNPLVRMTM